MIYAIDFGTSNSLLGAATKEELFPPVPLDPFARDSSILRSILFFPNPQECFFGAKAIDEFSKHDMQGRLIRSIKKFLPVRSFVGTYVDNRPLHLEDIIATFLGEMRRRANIHFNRDVDSVLLGRPARFSEDDGEDQLAQSRLELAAQKAGFKHIAFCAEPLAAAHEFRATLTEAKTFLVADFGGGTSDFTIIRMSPDGSSEVLGIGGVSVAGDALDGTIMRKRLSPHFGADVQYKVPFGSNILTMPIHLMEKICSPADISLLRERDTMEFFRNVQSWSLGGQDRKKMEQLFNLINEQIGFQLFEKIEAVKRGLSETDASTFAFKYLNIDLNENILRSEFDSYSEVAVGKIFASLDKTIAAAGITNDAIDIVCATGGTAKVTSIREGLAARFGAAKVQQHNHFHSIVHGLTRAAQEML